LILPEVFVPVAEEIGVMSGIGTWVLEKACLDAMSWPAHIKLAVNISPLQFKAQGFDASIFRALERSGLSPSRLELEITESVLLSAATATRDVLSTLKAKGIRIAMDDFGTGDSSFSYLRDFPFDRIKIDRSFVARLGETDRSLALVDAIVAMGASLGMSITAEGVDSADLMQTVRQRGCTEVQGFYICPPAPMDKVLAMLGKSEAFMAYCPQ
jgi:EAL domain-containing protein (putative c-di-GMP-specific phosphodiesterase class I)